MPSISVGNEIFKTKKILEDHVRSVIKKIGVCESIRRYNIEYYNFFNNLFKGHTEYADKTRNMVDISILNNEVFKNLELHIVNNDNSTIDISWRNCIYGKRHEYEPAMRNAIQYQIDEFKGNAVLICESCGSNDNPHVDHVVHFAEIVSKFNSSTILEKPTLFKSINGNIKAFADINSKYETEWKEFHKLHAILRILCKSCNLKRPKWKGST